MNRNPNALRLVHATAAAVILGTCLCIPVPAHAGPVTLGPLSELYLAAGDQFRLLGIQGSTVLFDNAMAPAEQVQYPIAVASTVRTLGFGFIATGGEYTLAGLPTGTTYTLGEDGNERFYDGTTNGTSNFAWDYEAGAAYQFSATWTSPTLLFTLGRDEGHRLGITYDPSNDSLWISGWDGTAGMTVAQYSLGGILISSFETGHGENAALALDPADGTLWLSNRTTFYDALTLEQFTRDGTPLGSVVFTGAQAGENVLGGEFQYTGTVVPEPASAVLLLVGAALLGRHRWR